MKDILITRGSFAGRVLSVHDDTAATALADKWAREPDTDPAAEGEAAGEVPQSLTDFEAMLNAGGLSTDAVVKTTVSEAKDGRDAKAATVSEAKDGSDSHESPQPQPPRATTRRKL